MALKNLLPANDVGTRWSKEESYKVLPDDRVWTPIDPNSYSDFGGNSTLKARNPIEQGRQRRKGVIVDLEASGGFNIDLTATNLEALMEGLMFASRRKKGHEDFGGLTGAAVDGTGNDFTATATITNLDGLTPGALIFASGFTNGINNGLHKVNTGPTTDSLISVGTDLVTETPPATATLDMVGFEFAAGELDVVVSGTWPVITYTAASTTFSFLDFGNGAKIVPGEWIYVGGDTAGTSFANAVNNGWKRVRAVTATSLTFDKSESDMVVETDTTQTVRLFFGTVLKNEDGTETSFPIVRSTYHLERDLGEPDDAVGDNQYEYLVGAVWNEATFNLSNAEIITVDASFIAADAVQFDSTQVAANEAYRSTGSSNTFPALVDTDAFNTTNDVRRFQMQLVDETDEAPTKLFAYLTDGTLVINNNCSQAKAIGVLGGFDVIVGSFIVSGSMTAYFVDVESARAVRENSDVTLDLILAKDNKATVFDMPLLALGDGRVNAEKDQAIKLPINYDAAKGSKVLSSYSHTLLWCFFPYIPDAAH